MHYFEKLSLSLKKHYVTPLYNVVFIIVIMSRLMNTILGVDLR